ncbi:MAG: glycosyltransferase family 4 protein [archaeon]
MGKVKLCISNAFFYPYSGGTEYHILENGKRLARKFEVHVLTSRIKNTKKSEKVFGMHVHRIPSYQVAMPLIYPPPLTVAPSAKKALEDLHKKYNFDVFNCHGRWFPDFAYSIKFAAKIGKPGVLTLHNARPFGINHIVSVLGYAYEKAYGIEILRKAYRIISVSEAAKWDICMYPGIDPDKIEVIHNGIDVEKFKPVEPSLRDGFLDGLDYLVLFTGRLIPQKGVHYLLKAFPEVLKEYPKTRLVICGRGNSLKSLMLKAKKFGISKNVIFPGFIPDEKMPALYSSCDVYVLPSLWEVLPFSLLEALACGRPLVATDAGGNPEIVDNGVNGFIVPKRSSAALAEKLNILLGDKTLREKMGKKSREIALKKFDWEIISKKTIDFYERVLREFK